MASRTFFDTNVLVYLFDADSPGKQARAREALGERLADGAVVVSTQVLQEFFVTVTRKLARPLPAGEAEPPHFALSRGRISPRTCSRPGEP